MFSAHFGGIMRISFHRRAVAAAVSVGGALAAIVSFAGPANAAAQHSSFPVAGMQLVCTNTTYTLTGGSVKAVFNETTSANGSVHVTGTDTASHITAVDPAGNTYRVVGADWFGGTFPAGQGGTFTDTNEFQVIAANGGMVDSVRVIEHLSPNGKSISFDFGTCAPPGG
jgi:hypothetical protein